MKKVFKIKDLDCPNCAAKLERAVLKTEGVTSASVNFLMQKLTVEAADSEFNEVMERVVKAAKRSNPDCTIVL